MILKFEERTHWYKLILRGNGHSNGGLPPERHQRLLLKSINETLWKKASKTCTTRLSSQTHSFPL